MLDFFLGSISRYIYTIIPRIPRGFEVKARHPVGFLGVIFTLPETNIFAPELGKTARSYRGPQISNESNYHLHGKP